MMISGPPGQADAEVTESRLTRQAEWDWWESRREELTATYAKRWIVIQGTQVTGSADSYSEALAAGYEAHGLAPFLVQFVAAFDAVAVIIL